MQSLHISDVNKFGETTHQPAKDFTTQLYAKRHHARIREKAKRQRRNLYKVQRMIASKPANDLPRSTKDPVSHAAPRTPSDAKEIRRDDKLKKRLWQRKYHSLSHPLHAAIRSGKISHVQCVLENVARDRFWDRVDDNGMTAWQLAAHLRHRDILKLLANARPDAHDVKRNLSKFKCIFKWYWSEHWRAELTTGTLCDVIDPFSKWYVARVIETHPKDWGKVRIHYQGWDNKYDEWIVRNSIRIQPHRSKTNPSSRVFHGWYEYELKEEWVSDIQSYHFIHAYEHFGQSESDCATRGFVEAVSRNDINLAKLALAFGAKPRTYFVDKKSVVELARSLKMIKFLTCDCDCEIPIRRSWYVLTKVIWSESLAKVLEKIEFYVERGAVIGAETPRKQMSPVWSAVLRKDFTSDERYTIIETLLPHINMSAVCESKSMKLFVDKMAERKEYRVLDLMARAGADLTSLMVKAAQNVDWQIMKMFVNVFDHLKVCATGTDKQYVMDYLGEYDREIFERMIWKKRELTRRRIGECGVLVADCVGIVVVMLFGG